MTTWTAIVEQKLDDLIAAHPTASNADLASLLSDAHPEMPRLSKDALQKLRKRRFGTAGSAPDVAPDNLIDLDAERAKRGLPPALIELIEATRRHEPLPIAPPAASPAPIASDGLWIVFGDEQMPYHNPVAVELALAFVESQRDRLIGVVGTGDKQDVLRLSKFGHDPRAMRFSDEVRMVRDYNARLRRAAGPMARIVEVPSNHTNTRINAYIERSAPELVGLHLPGDRYPLLSYPNLAGFEEFRIEWPVVETGQFVDEWNHGVFELVSADSPSGRLLVVHGWSAKKQAGANAQALADRWHCSVITGHVHRLNITELTRGGALGAPRLRYIAAEAGCLADEPTYLPHASADWQHGGLVVEVFEDGSWTIEPFRIDVARGELTWRSERIRIAA